MRNVCERNALVEQHLNLAHCLAKKRHRSVSPCVQFDELLSAAYSGLIDAASKYEEAKAHEKAKYPFPAYARIRIVGEMNDYLRSCNWGSRKNPQHMLSLNAKITRNDNRELFRTDMLYDDSKCVVDHLNSRELFEKIIRGLPVTAKHVFRLRYLEDLTMKEVAEKLDISESRVSQLISQHSDYLKDALRNRSHELWDEAHESEQSTHRGIPIVNQKNASAVV